jgi:ketosteroid isomerase-like protein
VTEGTTAEWLGREVIAAVERRDWAALAACLSEDVVFRAVISNEKTPFREHVGPDAAAAQIARWFDDGDVHQLVGSGVEMVADRLHVRYRVRNREDGTWYLVEQHLFATMAGDRISHLDLLCSGFRPVPPPA